MSHQLEGILQEGSIETKDRISMNKSAIEWEIRTKQNFKVIGGLKFGSLLVKIDCLEAKLPGLSVRSQQFTVQSIGECIPLK